MYNIELYVGQCIESGIKQNHTEIETDIEGRSTDRNGKGCGLNAT